MRILVMSLWISTSLLVLNLPAQQGRAEDDSAAIFIRKDNIAANKKDDSLYPTRCDVELVGRISKGTRDKFVTLYNDEKNDLSSHTILLCLDSMGGDVSEALSLASFIRQLDRPSIITAVSDGSNCWSACALVFMAGKEQGKIGEFPARFLYPRGTLRFHSTFFNNFSASDISMFFKDDPNKGLKKIYETGVQDVQRIVSTFSDTTVNADFIAKPFVSPSLFLEMFAQDPGEWVCIDTIDKMGRWDIQLGPHDIAKEPSKRKFSNACWNVYWWSRDQTADGRGAPTPDPKVTMPPPSRKLGGRNKENSDYFDERFVVDVDFTINNSRCVVEVAYEDEKKKANISNMRVYFVDKSGALVSNVSWANSSALFDPDTPIADLSKGKPAQITDLGALKGAHLPPFTRYENRQIAGCELRRLTNIDLEACEASCTGDKDCFAYSYKNSTRMCSIKNVSMAMRLDPLWQTGVRPGLEKPEESRDSIRKKVMDFQYGKQLIGKIVNIDKAASVEACAEQCSNVDKCLGVSFVADKNQCQFFESVDSVVDPVMASGANSAIKLQK
jgi:hypothetical protein